jgi:hypothetical protein
MPDSDRLRDRAARLLALAVKAGEDGKTLLSFELTRLATEASDQADEMDRRDLQVQHQQFAHEQPTEQPAQLQQQPQSEGEKG